MNVALVRVLYAHALVASPNLALGRLAPFSPVLGDPPARASGRVSLLRRVIPNDYPLTQEVEWYIADEQRLGRLLDYTVIAPRLQRLYEWLAEDLGEPRLLELIRDGSPIYVWPYEQRSVWHARHVCSRAGCSSVSLGSADAARPEPGNCSASSSIASSLRAGRCAFRPR